MGAVRLDEAALQEILAPAFQEVQTQRYWSTQSGVLQVLGERFAPPTTFGLLARNRR
jgi:hypothetical protein